MTTSMRRWWMVVWRPANAPRLSSCERTKRAAAACVLGSCASGLEACEVLAARAILLRAIGKVVIGSKLFGSEAQSQLMFAQTEDLRS
jgi:hypothetical protein